MIFYFQQRLFLIYQVHFVHNVIFLWKMVVCHSWIFVVSINNYIFIFTTWVLMKLDYFREISGVQDIHFVPVCRTAFHYRIFWYSFAVIIRTRKVETFSHTTYTNDMFWHLKLFIWCYFRLLLTLHVHCHSY